MYTAELNSNPDAETFVKQLKKLDSTTVTLLFSDKDTKYNNAVVLKKWLKSKLK
ncbi:hypothetical protein IV60_GL000907 [Lancefieldella rimae]|nr:hypothetical protein IV60_GL000907 [Lancefieldella rimae]